MKIKVKNVVIHEGIPFDEYLKMPGYSFSWLKNNGQYFEPSSKMKLGSAVDDYLNEPARFEGDLSIVKPLAKALIERVGWDLYHKFKKQASVTADFVYDGMKLQYKGRMDWCLKGMLIIDIKVSEYIESSIKFFDYPNQLSGYSIGTCSPIALILSIHPKKKSTDLRNISITEDWWIRKIYEYGRPNL